ncbi:LPXTG cell wall anchor domain-containing protein [Paenibacillus sp. LMG 31458]|uniref:LPXTG cell wall anchor domain-containing protein n=1 Tax=Paenibacillus phytorum TaxID=2654977 RepID=A0ABX1Y7P1_9BACL|nr:collagen binding domain-containing protein [Paenibacillus phytorum]NOU76559.1 LPXTG cell wall anchor domain-containing protein [Paenibacillus phytorum]
MLKKTSVLLITLLIFMQSIYGIGFFTEASAKTISNTILDSVTMAVYDSAGQVVTGNVYEPNSTIQLDYTWSLPNGHGYKSGDTYTFTLPQQFLLFNDISSNLVMGQDQLGTFHVDRASHQVLITFNNYIESHDNVHGTLTFRTKLDTSQLTESTTVTISIPVKSGDQIFTLHLRPSVTSTIEKRGISSGFNSKDIHWTIDVNKTLDSVQDAVVTDPIPTGLSVPVTVAVYDLGVHLNGTVVQGALVDVSKYTVSITGSDLTVRFTESPIHTAYRIQYTTPITDFNKKTFVNTATFGGSNKNPVQASATVQVTLGSSLDKIVESYNPFTQIISWGIKYNYNERTIAQSAAFLKDLFNDTQEIVAGSLHVYPVTFSSNGNEILGSELPSGEYTVTNEEAAGKKGFKIQFKNDISSAYKITYQTKASNPVMNIAIITNTVTSGSEASDSATQPIEQGAVHKYPGTVDYKAKTVAWHIVINRDSQLMNNVVVTDTFPKKGLRFIPDSLVIKKGNVIVPSTDYIFDSSVPVEDGFKVKFTNAISEPISIDYKTDFNLDLISPPGTTDFINSAKVDWIDSSEKTKTQTASATFIPRNEVKNNGIKYGAYDAASKKLEWTVGANYNGKAIADAIVQDTLESNQKFIDDPLKPLDLLAVYQMNIQANGDHSLGGKIAPSKYKYAVDSQNRLVVHFLQPISEPFYIVFKTSLQGQVINSSVSNTARAFNGTEPVSGNLSATLPIPKGGEYVSKSGSQSGDKINWSVQINYGQSTLNDAKIIDTPSINQQLLPNSFHLFATIVTSNGNVTKGTELTKGVDYKLVINTDNQGKQTFELSFVKQISTAYILEYQSLIMANDHETITNRIGLSGTNETTITRETTKEIVVGVSDGSGTGSGVRGSLTVKKIDSANNTLLLDGATFELKRKSGEKINKLTTDETGTVVFNNLLAGEYVVSEITAPPGYVLNKEDNPITLHPGDELHLNVINTKTTNTDSPPPESTNPPGGPTPPPTTPTPPPKPTPSPTPGATPPPSITPAPSVTPTPPTVPTPSTDPDIPIDTDNDVPLGGIPPITKPETLPKTGESSHLYVEIAGITLILLGLILRRRFTR